MQLMLFFFKNNPSIQTILDKQEILQPALASIARPFHSLFRLL